MKLSSNFAILDVKKGRQRLGQILGRCRVGPDPEGIPVMIRGRIVSAWGPDDGISREFKVVVEGVEV